MSIRELLKSIAKFGLITVAFAAIVGLSAYGVIQVVMRTGSVVEVPNVVGEGFYTASKRLGEIGLRVHVEEEVFSPVVPGDHITYQRPVAGARVKTGRVVLVHVSQGSKKITVPDVTNEELRRVGDRVTIPPKLRASALEVGQVSQIHYPAKERLILAQNPPPKSTIESGGKVDLLVSAGPRLARYLVPNVVGMKRDEAVQRLDRLNFQIQTDQEYKPRVERNTVLKQEPEQNETLEEGGLIHLTVSARQEGERKWENLRYLVVTYQVPLGISPDPARHVQPGFFLRFGAVEGLVRIEMTDALGPETVLRKTSDPGEIIMEVISYKEEATVKVLLDGVLRQQTEASSSGTSTFTIIQSGRDTYGTQGGTFDSFRGLR